MHTLNSRSRLRATVATFALCVCLLATNGARAETVAELYRSSYERASAYDYTAALKAMTEMPEIAQATYVWKLRSAWLRYLLEHVETSITLYREAATIEPRAIEPLLGLSLPLMKAGRWAEATTALQKANKLAPGDTTVLGRLAYVTFKAGRYRDCEGWYKAGLALAPGDADLRDGLGWCLLLQNRFQEAAVEFESVLAIAPDHLTARQGLNKIP
jgi:tetratricopeptide (TPR) repeat protein